jgi:transmembrane sensor
MRWALAACLAVGIVGAGLSMGWDLMAPTGLYEDKAFVTGAGQRSVITLADGSEVVLNGDTVMRTRAVAGERLIYLDKGQAFFRVAKDEEHPFVVQAGGRTITAVGTAFDVRVEPDQFAVTLVEGKVKVETPISAPPPAASSTQQAGRAPDAPSVETTEMIAGSQLVAADAARWSVARTDVDRATSWARDQLVFQAQPLAEVVAEMNRRSARKIVITDASVGETLVSGNFRPGDVEGFARAVQAYDYAEISSDSAGRIELSAR